ncbi:MAG TPA: anti-sigma factor [Solirubrobacterales bacterium]|jgi:anti-sigma factor RsiW|nr:anti-sigma factor [Solirubrobacterales bacterium]
MSHPSREDLTAHALGALDSAEEREVAAHCAECASCERELRSLAPAVGVLAESVEQREPPQGLRERLMAVVNEEAAAPEPAASRGRSRPARLRGLLLLRPATGLAVAAVAIAALAGYLVAGDDEGDRATTVPVTAEMPGAGGSLVVQGDQATLHVYGLPPVSKGGVYQVWVAKGGVATPSAAFVPDDDGTATAAVPEAAAGAEAVAVTREARPGATRPTLPSVLDATLN